MQGRKAAKCLQCCFESGNAQVPIAEHYWKCSIVKIQGTVSTFSGAWVAATEDCTSDWSKIRSGLFSRWVFPPLNYNQWKQKFLFCLETRARNVLLPNDSLCYWLHKYKIKMPCGLHNSKTHKKPSVHGTSLMDATSKLNLRTSLRRSLRKETLGIICDSIFHFRSLYTALCMGNLLQFLCPFVFSPPFTLLMCVHMHIKIT